MSKTKNLYLAALILFLPIFLFACKGNGKEASVEDTLKKHLSEHVRITNDVFYERGKDSGRPTTMRLAAPVRVIVDKSGNKAFTDALLEVRYVNENRSEKTPIRVTWELKNGAWSADRVLPEDFGFLISFDQKTLDLMKKRN